MKNILLLSILSLSLIGCGSNDDSPAITDDGKCTFTTNQRSASIQTSGILNGPPPPPSECQEFIISTDNGYIAYKTETAMSYHFYIPKGYTGTFQAYPNPGYTFDGWYKNDTKIDSLSFEYVSGNDGAVTIEAKMIPVAVQ